MPNPPPLPDDVQMPPALFIVGDAVSGDTSGALSGGATPDDATPDDTVIVQATDLTRGPWEHGIMHGGSVCGLLGWAIENKLREHCDSKYNNTDHNSTGHNSTGHDSTDHNSTGHFARLLCTRLTVEILSGIPVCQLAVRARVIKLGKRTATVDAEFWRTSNDPDAGNPNTNSTDVKNPDGKNPDGKAPNSKLLTPKLLARASSQWLITNPDTNTATNSGTADPADPHQAAHNNTPRGTQPRSSPISAIPAERSDPTANADIEYPRPGFNVDAVELRNIAGSTEQAGPGRSWMRLAYPLVARKQGAGEAAGKQAPDNQAADSTTKFARIATLSDMGAAVGWDHTPSGGSYINTDVTLQLLRLPVDEWVLMESRTVSVGNGVAANQTEIFDQAGHLGWVLQSKVEAPFQLH